MLCGGEPVFPAVPWKWEAPSPFPVSQPPCHCHSPPVLQELMQWHSRGAVTEMSSGSLEE